MISKKTEENTGSFYNQTRYPKEKLDGNKKETKLIPLKSGNNLRGKEGLKELSVEKYGGYQGGECAYFVLVKYYTVKNKKKTEEKQELKNDKSKKAEEKEDYVTVTASSVEELLKKINDTIYDSMSDHVKTPQEQLLGQHINFSA